MTAVVCDRFGFFNGIYGIEQSNWANYWRGIVPDGVLGGFGNELEVYAMSDGMRVHVKTGQAMVDNHRAWVTSEKELTIDTADSTNPRLDLVVLRCVYANSKESKVYVDVKTGTPAATPELPSLTQVTGETYEIPLAQVLVGAGVVTIASGTITDLRYVFHLPADSADSFSGTTLTVKNDHEYRNPTAIGSLTVILPEDPHETFMCSVCFASSSAFTSVTVMRGTGTTISGTSNLKLKGDALTLPSRRYNIVFYWDGSYYWAASAAVA